MLHIFIGSLIILIGILCNELLLAIIISPDAIIESPLAKVVIRVFNISLVSLGILILLYRNSLKRKRLCFWIVTLIVTLTSMELALQLLSFVFPRVDCVLSLNPKALSDERLIVRGNPKHPEHDEKGFRNKSVPQKVDVLAIGDSQTYGTGVNAGQDWPQQMQSLGKIETYWS